MKTGWHLCKFIVSQNWLHTIISQEYRARKNSTLWFLSSVSASVEISVLGLASAILASPQFSVLTLGIETRLDCWTFSNGNLRFSPQFSVSTIGIETWFDCWTFSKGNLWDSTWEADDLMLNVVVDCFCKVREQEKMSGSN